MDNERCYIFSIVKACSFCLYTAMKIGIGEKAKFSLSQAVDKSSIACLHSSFQPARDYLSRLKIRSEPETAIHWSISLYVHLRLLAPIQLASPRRPTDSAPSLGAHKVEVRSNLRTSMKTKI